MCCEVEVSATDPSLAQRNPTKCDVSEYDREALKMRKKTLIHYRLLCHGDMGGRESKGMGDN
jgi:hypothetical protein